MRPSCTDGVGAEDFLHNADAGAGTEAVLHDADPGAGVEAILHDADAGAGAEAVLHDAWFSRSRRASYDVELQKCCLRSNRI